MIRPAGPQDIGDLVRMGLLLFEESTQAELLEEFTRYVADPAVAVFVAEEQGCAIGFAHGQARQDYVEGSNTSPVGYLEALFVQAPFRRRGIGRALVQACEEWAKAHGCSQFASDTQLHNGQSLRFHLGAGFREAGRVIAFIKDL